MERRIFIYYLFTFLPKKKKKKNLIIYIYDRSEDNFGSWLLFYE